jgi:hypothetical protein
MKLNVALPRNPSLPWSVPRRDQWSGDAEMTLDSLDPDSIPRTMDARQTGRGIRAVQESREDCCLRRWR